VPTCQYFILYLLRKEGGRREKWRCFYVHVRVERRGEERAMEVALCSYKPKKNSVYEEGKKKYHIGNKGFIGGEPILLREFGHYSKKCLQVLCCYYVLWFHQI
jgi:hypothetical protein